MRRCSPFSRTRAYSRQASCAIFFRPAAQRDKIAKFLEPLSVGVKLIAVDVKKDE